MKIQNWIRRSAIAASAATLTITLFAGMSELVKVEKLDMKQTELRTLDRVVLNDENSLTVERQARKRPEMIATVTPPPRPPLQKVSSPTMFVHLVVVGESVERIPRGRLKSAVPAKISFERRKAFPVRQPLPAYPPRAASRGLEGYCEISFDLDPRGKPYNLEALCSDPMFRNSSIKAVRSAEFAARIVDGKPIGQEGLVYPITFKLNED